MGAARVLGDRKPVRTGTACADFFLACLIKTLRLQRLVSCLILVDDVVTCNIHTEWLNVISHSTVYLVASSSVLKIFTSSSIPQVLAPSFYIPIATTSFSLSLSLALI